MTAQPGGRLMVAGRTDKGRRRADNQDGFLITELGAETADLGQPPEGDTIEFEAARGVTLLVADGMGGRIGGARASALAVETIAGHLAEDGGDAARLSLPRSLHSSLCAANAAIHSEAGEDQARAGMGTTATLAGVLGDAVYVAQVGDSRAYLVRGGEVVRLTRDQSLVQDMVDSGLLEEAQAHTVPNNMLLQALGVHGAVKPAVTYHALRRDDVLILCSDGLSQLVRDHELAEVASPDRVPQEVCERLVNLANQRGGPDNITVVVARAEGLAFPAVEAEDALGPLPWAGLDSPNS